MTAGADIGDTFAGLLDPITGDEPTGSSLRYGPVHVALPDALGQLDILLAPGFLDPRDNARLGTPAHNGDHLLAQIGRQYVMIAPVIGNALKTIANTCRLAVAQAVIARSSFLSGTRGANAGARNATSPNI